jgi:hypothetical protein
MKRTSSKVIYFQSYKRKKHIQEVDRKELLELIKKVVTTK